MIEMNSPARAILCTVLLLVMAIATLSSTALAVRSDVDSIVNIGSGVSEISSICARANQEVNQEILVYTSSDGLLSFSNKIYATLTDFEKKGFMEVALGSITSSGMSTQSKNKAYNFIYNQDSAITAAIKLLQSDVSADLAKASAWFRPFSGSVSTVFGMLALLIFLFLSFSVVMDLSYMFIPFFQLFLDREEGKRPMFVSGEAWHSVRESTSSSTYKSSIGEYLKKRVPIVFLATLCLGYLISGQIYDVLIFFIDAFSGLGR